MIGWGVVPGRLVPCRLAVASSGCILATFLCAWHVAGWDEHDAGIPTPVRSRRCPFFSVSGVEFSPLFFHGLVEQLSGGLDLAVSAWAGVFAVVIGPFFVATVTSISSPLVTRHRLPAGRRRRNKIALALRCSPSTDGLSVAKRPLLLNRNGGAWDTGRRQRALLLLLLLLATLIMQTACGKSSVTGVQGGRDGGYDEKEMTNSSLSYSVTFDGPSISAMDDNVTTGSLIVTSVKYEKRGVVVTATAQTTVRVDSSRPGTRMCDSSFSATCKTLLFKYNTRACAGVSVDAGCSGWGKETARGYKWDAGSDILFTAWCARDVFGDYRTVTMRKYEDGIYEGDYSSRMNGKGRFYLKLIVSCS
jgi:hypothetical protein